MVRKKEGNIGNNRNDDYDVVNTLYYFMVVIKRAKDQGNFLNMNVVIG
jgi:hypothetical protein